MPADITILQAGIGLVRLFIPLQCFKKKKKKGKKKKSQQIVKPELLLDIRYLLHAQRKSQLTQLK